MKQVIPHILILIISVISFSCQNKDSNHNKTISSGFHHSNNLSIYKVPPRPTIAGHLGQDTIIGNFTGKGIDSIWIVERVDTLEDGTYEYNYHTASNNPLLPSVELYGRSSHCAFIVNEGDLNGDGKDVLGWMRGSFRSYATIDYHLLHFSDEDWKEFTIGLDSDTRNASFDVIRKGNMANSIIVNFLYWSEEETSDKVIGYDTIFYPFKDKPLLFEH